MFRLVSLLGIACLAVAAVKITSRSAVSIAPRMEIADIRNRFPGSACAVLTACPAYHLGFSLN